MMGEDLTEAFVSPSGLIGDRCYAFVDQKSENKSFPWMTARQGHEMILYNAKFLDEGHVEIESPEGLMFSVRDDALLLHLEQRFDRKLTLVFNAKGNYDSRPISLFSLQTLEQLCEETDAYLEAERFRANFFVDWNNKRPFFEDSLVGETLQIGSTAKIRVDKKNVRCVIPTLDTKTAQSNPRVLDTLGKSHETCAGVYAVVLEEGIVRPKDTISLV